MKQMDSIIDECQVVAAQVVDGKTVLNRSSTVSLRHGRVKIATKVQIMETIFHWLTWSYVTFLLFSQLLGIVWNTVEKSSHVLYGESPTLGLKDISGNNDEPYSDRSIVCMNTGQYYKPMILNDALKDARTEIVSTDGSDMNGYRVVTRNEVTTMTTDMYGHYLYKCEQIFQSLQGIQDSCDNLGYNVTRDALRIVNGVDSSVMHIIPNALPILLKPFWDYGLIGHNIIPGWDGSACIFRLFGKYQSEDQPIGIMRSIMRSDRESKTVEWLDQAGGVWKNGWYEDLNGDRWYSDVIVAGTGSPLAIPEKAYDPYQNSLVDCKISSQACDGLNEEWFGSQFSVTETTTWYDNVAISNGSRYGLFIYEAETLRVVKSPYDLETFIANCSVGMVLFRWLITVLALHHSYFAKISNWYAAGIGSLAGAKSFSTLPILMLPRLKVLITVFFITGLEFEGPIRALSESWFVIYPSLAAFVLMYFSLLNLLAKLMFRRISDILFFPTLLFFSAMHWSRMAIAQSGLFEFDGRISSIVQSSEYKSLTVADLLLTNAGYRMSGQINSLLWIKIGVLLLNLIPLFVGYADTSPLKGISKNYKICQVEQSLALRASRVGGLGKSASIYECTSTEEVANDNGETSCQRPLATGPLNGYELSRLGYLIFGGKFLISFDDWCIITAATPLRSTASLWNHRITVFIVENTKEGIKVEPTAQLRRLDDQQLLSISAHDVAVCPCI